MVADDSIFKLVDVEKEKRATEDRIYECLQHLGEEAAAEAYAKAVLRFSEGRNKEVSALLNVQRVTNQLIEGLHFIFLGGKR